MDGEIKIGDIVVNHLTGDFGMINARILNSETNEVISYDVRYQYSFQMLKLTGRKLYRDYNVLSEIRKVNLYEKFWLWLKGCKFYL